MITKITNLLNKTRLDLNANDFAAIQADDEKLATILKQGQNEEDQAATATNAAAAEVNVVQQVIAQLNQLLQSSTNNKNDQDMNSQDQHSQTTNDFVDSEKVTNNINDSQKQNSLENINSDTVLNSLASGSTISEKHEEQKVEQPTKSNTTQNRQLSQTGTDAHHSALASLGLLLASLLGTGLMGDRKKKN